MYNFGIPASLKSWVDYFCQPGRTFGYNKKGEVIGLVTGKKVYLAIATGNVYSHGESKVHDYTETYLRSVLGHLLGMNDITAVRVEGVAIPGIKEFALEKAMQTLLSGSFG